MGFAPPLTQAALRVSVGWTTTDEDVERFQNAWRKAYGALSKGLKDKRGIAA
jgi:cysteine desulfurase